MNKINLCLENSLNSASGKLQPVILKVILELLKNDVHVHTARLIKTKCIELKSDVNWDERLPAICNAMRNAIKCGGRIISEDRDFLDFTIVFENDEFEGKFNLNGKTVIQDKNQKTKRENNNLQKIKTDLMEIVDEKIKALIDSLNQEKVNDKNRKKLLIIGCSDSKDISNPINAKNLFKDCFGHELKEARERRMDQYIKLLKDEKNEKYFKKKRNGKEVDSTYFFDSLKGDLYYAIDLYGSNSSPFFKKSMKECYYKLIKEHNFKILIISGLYGVLEPYDTIRDYQLQINKTPFWTRNHTVQMAIAEYIKREGIENDLVFYSLSTKGNDPYVKALKPNEEWNDLWIGHARGNVSIRFLREYFLPNL